LERPAGPGYFAVGDAAAVLDPASSHGVLRALLSGMLAGQLIAAVIRRGLPEAIGEREYRAWIGSSVERDVTRLGDLYRRCPEPPWWLAGPDGARPGAPR
jgi:flavin-dependent dehydrogenase